MDKQKQCKFGFTKTLCESVYGKEGDSCNRKLSRVDECLYLDKKEEPKQ